MKKGNVVKKNWLFGERERERDRERQRETERDRERERQRERDRETERQRQRERVYICTHWAHSGMALGIRLGRVHLDTKRYQWPSRWGKAHSAHSLHSAEDNHMKYVKSAAFKVCDERTHYLSSGNKCNYLKIIMDSVVCVLHRVKNYTVSLISVVLSAIVYNLVLVWLFSLS